MQIRFRHGYALIAFVSASILNPGYFVGCGPSESAPHFQYGADEMAQLVLAGDDSYEFELDGARYRIDLEIEPVRESAKQATRSSPLTSVAYACGNRKLVATAAACIDSSSMQVHGKLSLLRLDADGGTSEVAVDVPVQGVLWVPSLTLNYGQLQLSFANGALDLVSLDGRDFELGSHDLHALLPADSA